MGRVAQVSTLVVLIVLIVGVAYFFTIINQGQSATLSLVPKQNTCIFTNSMGVDGVTVQVPLNRQCSYDLTDGSGIKAMLTQNTWTIQGSKVKCVVAQFEGIDTQEVINKILSDIGLRDPVESNSSCFNIIFFTLDKWSVLDMSESRITFLLRI